MDSEVKQRVSRLARNFIGTQPYQKLQSGCEHRFEFAFSGEMDGRQINGSIDLVYFNPELEGYVIVDFKTNNTEGKDLEKLAIESGYDQQLAFYKKVLEREQGKGSVKRCEIVWLDSGKSKSVEDEL